MSSNRVDRVFQKLMEDVETITRKTYPPGITEKEETAAKFKEYEQAFENCKACMVRFSREEIEEVANRLSEVATQLRMPESDDWKNN